jgi:hypothetical protein
MAEQRVTKGRLEAVGEFVDEISAFTEGYEQGVREVMEEVKSREPSLYSTLVHLYPGWAVRS